jgi:hypothetical protein
MTEETKNTSEMNVEQLDAEDLESVNGGIKRRHRRRKVRKSGQNGSATGTSDSENEPEE